jgi:hypothetical protein
MPSHACHPAGCCAEACIDSRMQVILSGEVKPGPHGVQLGTAANAPPGETWLAGQTLHRTKVLPAWLITFLAYVPGGQAAGSNCKGSQAHNSKVVAGEAACSGMSK